ncbi:MAG: Crp/Fnr family transcriptional regulator [Cyanobacteria bacterium P01_A01_bin.135]
MPLLTPTDLPPQLQQRAQVLSAKQLLFQQGEPAQHLYWLSTGQLRLVTFVNDRMITHYFVAAQQLFAENVLYLDTYSCTAMAEVPSEVIAIPKAAFLETLRQSSALSERYVASLTQRFQSVKTLLELRSISSARDRLLHYLMQRRDSEQNAVVLDKPLRAIASELALTPESLSRLLSRLEAEGVMRRRQRRITFSEEWLEDVAN